MMIPNTVALATMYRQLAALAQGGRAAPAPTPEPEFTPFKLARRGARGPSVGLSAVELLPLAAGALAEVRGARDPGRTVTGRHAVVARPARSVGSNVGRE